MPAPMRAIRPTHRAVARGAVMRPALGLLMLATLGACASRPAADTGLNKDLALADQLQRQSAPALVTSPELASVSPDSGGARVDPAPRPHAAVVRTRVITRVVAAGVTPAAHAARAGVPRGIGRADAGEVIAARSVSPGGRQSSGAEGAYGSGTPAGTSEAGTYGASPTGAGTDGAGGPSTAGSAGGGYDASAPVYRQPQAHAARDGVFGSVAGAIIGAVASGRGNRVRGGLIGAVAGGALGAIYGGSVDRSIPTYAAGSRWARADRTY